ncbi:MAG TPA: ferrous iron transport protein B [bacterium]|nr:ferrous iron transport protein B [bacterium]
MADGRTIRVAIAGNPNCGKTALFNSLTGGHQQVGNWPGVTVERRMGRRVFDGFDLEITDLPGTYSLSPLTPDQLVARDFITSGEPDVIVNILDGSNLERNLYLTTQLLELGLPLVVAVNMMDVVESRGDTLDTAALAELLGCPVVGVVAVKRRGLDELLAAVVRVFTSDEPRKEVHVHYGRDLEREIARVEGFLQEHPEAFLGGPPRWQAVKLLESDAEYQSRLARLGEAGKPLAKLVEESRERLRSLLGHDPEDHFVEAAYGFAAGAIRETLTRNVEGRVKTAEKIDHVLTHRIWGLPIFAVVLWLTFEVTFRLGEPLMGVIGGLFGWLGGLANTLIPAGLVRSLVADGIIGGVGGVLVFVPNILLLFVMISLLEDSGYMARGAFVMDRLMHRLGLHGKSFIPMVIGFGCTVPAVMAARTLENPRDRLVTILTVPLMSCGARLPVYILLAGAFFPARYAGTVIFAVYALGIVLAVVAAKVLRSTVLKGEQVPFVMELPPYHAPTVKAVLLHAWNRAWMYIRKAGTVILLAMIVIWALTAFPLEPEDGGKFDGSIAGADAEYVEEQTAVAASLGLGPAEGSAATGDGFLPELENDAPLMAAVHRLEALESAPRLPGLGTAVMPTATGADSLLDAAGKLLAARDAHRSRLAGIEADREAERLYHTPLGVIGRGVSVVMEPLGFDWKVSSALVAGFAAKEVVVGTFGVLYSESGGDAGTAPLQGRLKEEWDARTGGGGWLVALSLMVFVLVYVPCVAVLAVIRRETGKWRWVAFTAAYLTVLAWLAAGLTRLVGSLWL